jgi:D-sedoheptulose 7-phosphate isomerase
MSANHRVDFAARYVQELSRVLAALPLEPLGQALALLEKAYSETRRVFVIGNGGSAATSAHMANDLLWGVAQTGKRGFRVTSLSDNVPVLTAIANDASYADIFTKQLEAQAESGDLLIAISGSGNSENVVRGVELAKRMGLLTVGFLGMKGGKLKSMVDIAIVVPSDDYGPIEDVHMMLDHLVTAYLRQWVGESTAVHEGTG